MLDIPAISPPPLVPFVAASATFPLTLFLSQALQHAFSITTSDRLPPLGLPRSIISGSRWTPFKLLPRPNCTAIGFASVCLATLTASTTYDYMCFSGPSSHRPSARPSTASQAGAHLLRTTFLGVFIFSMLGGRMYAVSPSSLISRGAYFRRGIPASAEYATAGERTVLRGIFKRHGCHTCGYRPGILPSARTFHADHVPPLSVVKYLNGRGWRGLTGAKVKQVFAPQCTKCSGLQGGHLAAAAKGKEWVGANKGVMHFRFRPCLLAGAGVNAMKGEGGEGEWRGMVLGGMARFRRWEAEAERFVTGFLRKM